MNITQFSYHVAIGIGASATDSSQQYGVSNCMAVGIFITNNSPNSVLVGFSATEGNATPRGVILCDATGVKVSNKGAKLGGTIADHFADASTPNSTTETDLFSDTLAAGLLDTNGDKITARYSGILVNSTSTKEVKLKFAGNTLLDTGALTMTGAGTFDINVLIVRVSSTGVRYIAECTLSGTSTIVAPQYGVLTGLSPNLSNSQILKITGQSGGSGTAANDVVAKIGTVKWEGAA